MLLQVDASEKRQNGVIINVKTIKILSRVIYFLLRIKGNSIKDKDLYMLVGNQGRKGYEDSSKEWLKVQIVLKTKATQTCGRT